MKTPVSVSSYLSTALLGHAVWTLFWGQISLTFLGNCGASAQLELPLHQRDMPEFPRATEAVSEKITDKQIIQSRFNFGVNLGSTFVRENWIFPALFPQGTTTELDAVAHEYSKNKEEAKASLEKHWKSFMSDGDWDWLKKNYVNSVRVPVGYWNVDGGRFTQGTKFEKYKEVYENSWSILKKYYIEPAAKRGISVLVDLHGVPGSANVNDHNGEQTGVAEFWTSPSYQETVIKALAFVADDLKNYDNICGIQLVNEAEYAVPGTAQKVFYAAALTAIREKDQAIPVVISDGWNPNQWAEWVKQGQGNGAAGLVVDHHFYKCFIPADTGRTADQIIKALDDELLPGAKETAKGVDFMVGEWASVLADETWKNSGIDPKKGDDPKRAQLEAEFGRGEERLIELRASYGSYFWTFKFEYGSGGGWDFHQQLGRSLEAPVLKVPDDLTLEDAFNQASSQIKSDLAKAGFTTAWNDGLVFARKGALIGRREAVKIARWQQRKDKGNLAGMDEWAQGYDKGLQALESSVRVC